MAKFGYNVNTNRMQRDVYFTSGNMQGKYNTRNSWIEYLMKLFQNQKLESELNDFQSVLIVSSHPLFLNEEG